MQNLAGSSPLTENYVIGAATVSYTPLFSIFTHGTTFQYDSISGPRPSGYFRINSVGKSWLGHVVTVHERRFARAPRGCQLATSCLHPIIVDEMKWTVIIRSFCRFIQGRTVPLAHQPNIPFEV